MSLLCYVPVQGENITLITIMYDKPHDVPVNKDHADTITTEIKTDQNKKLTFCFSKVIVK